MDRKIILLDGNILEEGREGKEIIHYQRLNFMGE
jgi:hypothetical protein